MIVRLTGGLGNQMFLYAFGRAVGLDRGLQTEYYFGRSTWDYALDPYKAHIQLVNQPVHTPKYVEPVFAFDPNVYTTPPDIYYNGYFQSEKYFKKHEATIREELSLKTPVREHVSDLALQMRSENSVFIHVRLGDYMKPGTKEFHGSLPWEYYRAAKRHVEERVSQPKYYFFSDEPETVRQMFYTNFSLGREGVIDGFTQHEDLYLMRNCRHGIGANSTFSWWANWLGDYPGRVCVAPYRWFANPDIDTSDLIPKRWTRL